MADSDDKDDAKPKSDWEAVHEEALKEYERDYERERNNIDEAYEDLRFRRGRLEDQWDAQAREARKGRPMHVVNKLPQFIRQVTGDMRQSRPGIKVVPVDSGADIKTAEVRAGMIRYVENRSKAKHVYTTGADSQVTCGIGHWAVTTEYAHAGTFNQEIRIVGIEDGVSVLWDADAILPTKSDADHCFVPTDMTRAKFERQWPNAKADGFDTAIYGITTGCFDSWATDDFIRVQQYWKKKPIKRTLALMPDGTIDDLTEQVADLPKEVLREAFSWLETQRGARVEQRDSYRICRYLLTMSEVLEEADWPGMHIPVIPVIGEEVRVGRDVYRHGIVRYARDLQRMENYYA
ncbi:portal protein, partial [Bradyrhizobium sp. Leo121]|uniref:portal protein n=1 Tax=Bradyrhizobium sp. Leo121 TaxID=1571195 RepID=UPI0010F42415